MNTNTLLTIGTLMLTVFVAGSHFSSSRSDREALQKEIADLKANQIEILANVAKANADYELKKTKFNEATTALNQKIETLVNKKKELVKENVETNNRIGNTKQGIEFDLSRLNKYIALNPLKADTSTSIVQ